MKIKSPTKFARESFLVTVGLILVVAAYYYGASIFRAGDVGVPLIVALTYFGFIYPRVKK